MDSLILILNKVCRKISDNQCLRKQIKQLSTLLPVIDENKDLRVTMASMEDIADLLKYH